MEELAQAQARTERRVEELAQAQIRTEQTIARMQITLGDLKGRQLERDYRDKAYAYFGALLRRVQVVSLQDLEEDLQQHLSDQQIGDLMPLDLLINGQPRRQPDAPRVWLAVEVSAVVDQNDVERAQRRAAILQEAGYRAIPTVAGEQITPDAEEAAREAHILVLRDGRAEFWEEALAQALTN